MKKILFGLISIGLSLGIVGSTFAYFTDVETSTNNTISAGIWHLQIDNSEEWFGNGVNRVSTSWTMSNMIPGVTTAGPFSVTLHDSEIIAADHVEISFSHTDTPSNMAKWVEITSMTYDSVNLVASQVDVNGNGIFDLEDVTLPPYNSDGGLLDNLPAPVGTGTKIFTLALKLSSQAPNGIQSDTLISTVYFTLNQNSSQ